MNDSDETDLLLLIPPDFFMAQPSSVQSPGGVHDEDEFGSSVSAPMYRRLQSGSGAALSNIQSNHHANGPAGSGEQSFRSSGSVHTRDGLWTTAKDFVHSTPKVVENTMPWRNSAKGEADPVIREIDRFLLGNGDTDGKYFNKMENNVDKSAPNRSVLKDKFAMDGQRMSTGFASPMVQRKLIPGVNDDEEQLMSLSSMWAGRDNKMSESQTGAQEERMRRKHCEDTIQVLQQKVLELEQKISVAIKVDRRKDEVLAAAKQSYAQLALKVDTLEKALDQTNRQLNYTQQSADSEISNLKRSNDSLQSELSRTLVSTRHLNECNELLEKKIAHVTRTTTEVRSGQQQKIAELQVRLSNAAKSEEILSAELNKWKSMAVKLKSEGASDKNQLEREFREQMDSLQAKEKTLLKELETQRHSLKAFYQNQLDDAVAQKLIEFQQQLDSVELNMRKEGKQRERTIAERAIRQMELINQKNEQEFTLLTEKHHEEIDLHRIQLENANKLVAELTQKVDGFQSKRSDIAERLHTVMETQWQRALEILASPTTSHEKSDHSGSPTSGGGDLKTNAENEGFQTPTSTGRRCLTANKTDAEQRGQQGNVDRVQEYIELLLEKSPRDLKGLETILDTPSIRSETTRRSGSEGAQRVAKYAPRPWK